MILPHEVMEKTAFLRTNGDIAARRRNLDSLQDFGNIQGGLRQAGDIALQTAASVSKVKEVLSTRRIILNRLGWRIVESSEGVARGARGVGLQKRFFSGDRTEAIRPRTKEFFRVASGE